MSAVRSLDANDATTNAGSWERPAVTWRWSDELDREVPQDGLSKHVQASRRSGPEMQGVRASKARRESRRGLAPQGEGTLVPGQLNSDELELLALEALGKFKFSPTADRLFQMRIRAACEWHLKRRMRRGSEMA